MPVDQGAGPEPTDLGLQQNGGMMGHHKAPQTRHHNRAPSAFAAVVLAMSVWAMPSSGRADAGLTLVARIPLGAVSGRIDHLAIDSTRQRLFIAELGNDTIGVVDLAGAVLLTRIAGFSEPQGIEYDPVTDQIFVANGGSGQVSILSGSDFHLVMQTQLAGDADNIRLAGFRGHATVYVGYGDGGIAALDPASGAVIADYPLAAHPEGFQIDDLHHQIYVNMPFAQDIAAVDLTSGQVIGNWQSPGAAGNFPMALDAVGRRLYVAYRVPPRLVVFDTQTGTPVQDIPVCADPDDVFLDDARAQAYVICGQGVIAVVSTAGKLVEVGRVGTQSGARTGLFVPGLDRLFVAVRASGDAPAEIRIYQPD